MVRLGDPWELRGLSNVRAPPTRCGKGPQSPRFKRTFPVLALISTEQRLLGDGVDERTPARVSAITVDASVAAPAVAKIVARQRGPRMRESSPARTMSRRSVARRSSSCSTSSMSAASSSPYLLRQAREKTHSRRAAPSPFTRGHRGAPAVAKHPWRSEASATSTSPRSPLLRARRAKPRAPPHLDR